MKRFISIFALSLMMFCGAYAAPENESANAPQENKETVAADTTKKPVADNSAKANDENTEAAKSGRQKKNEKDKAVVEEESARTSLHPLISAILAVLALGFAAFVFFNSKSRYDELLNRYRRVKDDLKSLSFDISCDITNRMESQNIRFDGKLTALKDQILADLKSTKAVETGVAEIKPEVVAEPEPPKFVSQTFYGIYKSKVNGVYVDQITEMREGNSTLEIVTVSDNEADVHLVEGLTKTQFSGLMGDAVQVTEGNPQLYETITEEEAGHMTLNEDVWTLTQSIKVKLA